MISEIKTKSVFVLFILANFSTSVLMGMFAQGPASQQEAIEESKADISQREYALAKQSAECGDLDSVIVHVSAALSAAVESGDKVFIAEATHHLGEVAYNVGDYEQAKPLLEISIEASKEKVKEYVASGVTTPWRLEAQIFPPALLLASACIALDRLDEARGHLKFALQVMHQIVGDDGEGEEIKKLAKELFTDALPDFAGDLFGDEGIDAFIAKGKMSREEAGIPARIEEFKKLPRIDFSVIRR